VARRKDNPLHRSRVHQPRVADAPRPRAYAALDDLGLQGELPRESRLLDYLAATHRPRWDVKHAIRNIVLSARTAVVQIERRSSARSDPFNKIVGRQGSFRLDAEFVRDNALAISGLLVGQDRRAEREAVPAGGLLFALNFPPREWERQARACIAAGCTRGGSGVSCTRACSRSTPRRVRSAPPSAPRKQHSPAGAGAPERPTYVEAARVLAEKTVRQGGADTTARIQWAFGRACRVKRIRKI